MLNRCEFIGNVGRDPEIRSTQSGDQVANFTLAVTDRWKAKDGERKERTTWVPVSVWGAVVSVVERFVRKGSKIYIAGSFEVRKWQDQSGADRYSTEVVLRPYRGELVLLDGKQGDEERYTDRARLGPDGLENARTGAPLSGFDDDEIPF